MIQYGPLGSASLVFQPKLLCFRRDEKRARIGRAFWLLIEWLFLKRIGRIVVARSCFWCQPRSELVPSRSKLHCSVLIFFEVCIYSWITTGKIAQGYHRSLYGHRKKWPETFQAKQNAVFFSAGMEVVGVFDFQQRASAASRELL